MGGSLGTSEKFANITVMVLSSVGGGVVIARFMTWFMTFGGSVKTT